MVRQKNINILAWIVALSTVFIALLLLVGLIFSAVDTTTLSASIQSLPIQDEPELEIIPASLERLSWGAIIAGTLITLMIMFMLNLAGIAAGLTQVNLDYGHDSPDAKKLASESMIWVIVSNLIALMLGGALAAYMAGIPEALDSVLHGVMVWALSGLITMILFISGVGQVMNGLSGLISSGFKVAGSITSGVGQVAGGVLQTAAAGAGNVAQGAAHAVGNVAGEAGHIASSARSTLEKGAQRSADTVKETVSNMTDEAIENSPDVKYALEYEDLRRDEIKHQIQQLIREAGKDPNKVEQQANAAANDVQKAAQRIVEHPERADQIISNTLQRVLRRGQEVANDVDRDALVNLLTERTDMTEQEVRSQIKEWESQFSDVKQQTEKARETARQKAEQYRQKAEEKAQEVYDKAQSRAKELQAEAEAKVEELRQQAEAEAREAAQAAADTFAKLAAGIAVAMILGAVAAGLGGFVATPTDLPDVPIEEASISLEIEPAYDLSY